MTSRLVCLNQQNQRAEHLNNYMLPMEVVFAVLRCQLMYRHFHTPAVSARRYLRDIESRRFQMLLFYQMYLVCIVAVGLYRSVLRHSHLNKHRIMFYKSLRLISPLLLFVCFNSTFACS